MKTSSMCNAASFATASPPWPSNTHMAVIERHGTLQRGRSSAVDDDGGMLVAEAAFESIGAAVAVPVEEAMCS